MKKQNDLKGPRGHIITYFNSHHLQEYNPDEDLKVVTHTLNIQKSLAISSPISLGEDITKES